MNASLHSLVRFQEAQLFITMEREMLMVEPVIFITLQQIKKRSRRLRDACWAGTWTMEEVKILRLQTMIKRSPTTTFIDSLMDRRYVRKLLLFHLPLKYMISIENNSSYFSRFKGFWRVVRSLSWTSFYGISWTWWWGKACPSTCLRCRCESITYLSLFLSFFLSCTLYLISTHFWFWF